MHIQLLWKEVVIQAFNRGMEYKFYFSIEGAYILT